jgi:hypothetical protein
LAQPAPPTSGSDELRAVFQQLMLDPGNTALNMRYAELNAQRGETARAVATYERILAEDPNNVAARRALERLQLLFEPPTTSIVATLGARYETNAPRRDPSFLTFNDTAASASLSMQDERVLGDRRWRSFAAGYIDAHNRFQTGDIAYVGGNTGPILPFIDGWTVRPAIGGAYVARHYKTMYGEGDVLANFETRTMGALEQVNLRFAAQDWSGRDPGKDALIGQVGLGFRWSSLAVTDDLVSFDPVLTFNGAETSDNAYVSIGFTLGYIVPVAPLNIGIEPTSFLGRSALGIEFHLEHADYDAPDRRIGGTASDRRDTYLAPGIRLITPSILGLNENWTLRYLFEDNLSNEFINKYRNHTYGLSASWRL